MKPAVYTFDINVPQELNAGLYGFSDLIQIVVRSGDPGGELGDFFDFMRACLDEWYDRGNVVDDPGDHLIDSPITLNVDVVDVLKRTDISDGAKLAIIAKLVDAPSNYLHR